MKLTFKKICLLLITIIIVFVITNLNVGYLDLTFYDFFYETDNSQIATLRLNRVLAMFLVGISMPTSGFLLQEYFQNPLAGPSVLGITSVASLSVVLYIIFSQDIVFPDWLSNGFMSLSSILGSIILMSILLAFSSKFPNKSFIIIFGFLISALSGAIISLIQLYTSEQNLKNYVLWSFGANNQINIQQISILILFVFVGLCISFKCIKPLIGNSLGTNYAQSFGVNLNRLKYGVIVSSSLLSASITAFLGPILFIGIVVPHFCRLIFTPSKLWHQWILNMIVGVFIMQMFSIISEYYLLPINIITTVFGIPIILLMLLKSKI